MKLLQTIKTVFNDNTFKYDNGMLLKCEPFEKDSIVLPLYNHFIHKQKKEESGLLTKGFTNYVLKKLNEK